MYQIVKSYEYSQEEKNKLPTTTRWEMQKRFCVTKYFDSTRSFVTAGKIPPCYPRGNSSRRKEKKVVEPLATRVTSKVAGYPAPFANVRLALFIRDLFMRELRFASSREFDYSRTKQSAPVDPWSTYAINLRNAINSRKSVMGRSVFTTRGGDAIN